MVTRLTPCEHPCDKFGGDMSKLHLAVVVAAAVALSSAPIAAETTAKPVSLGIQFSGNPEGTEAEVVQMLPDRTGAAIGFKVGDILIEAGGKPLSREALMAYMKQLKEGDQVSFKVRRAGAIVELTGTGMAAPEGSPPLPTPSPSQE
jgi:S1-C subfamily serine protease